MRIFVAVELPEFAREELARAIDAVRPAATEARWVPPQNLHLTLAFVGETPEGDVPPIIEAVTAAASSVPAFETRLEGIGAFPSPRRARVLWAGLADSGAEFSTLAEAVLAGLEGVGRPRETREFTPHVTLARFRTPALVSTLPDVTLDPRGFPVESICVMRSTLARPAPRYEVLARAPLGGA